MTLDDCPPVLTVAQAAEVALADAKTIRKAIHSGKLRALVDGRVIRITRESVRAWLNGGDQEQQPARLRRLA